jgi:hypothetical protein
VEQSIDGEIAKAIDELIGPMAPQVNHLMGLLKQGAYLSNGPGSALMIGAALFVVKYEKHRSEGAETQLALQCALADAANNELVQKHLVGATTFTIDQAAGVNT